MNHYGCMFKESDSWVGKSADSFKLKEIELYSCFEWH